MKLYVSKVEARRLVDNFRVRNDDYEKSLVLLATQMSVDVEEVHNFINHLHHLRCCPNNYLHHAKKVVSSFIECHGRKVDQCQHLIDCTLHALEYCEEEGVKNVGTHMCCGAGCNRSVEFSVRALCMLWGDDPENIAAVMSVIFCEHCENELVRESA